MATDWYERGCKRTCFEKHTLIWGDCADAPESARPEPTVSMSYIYTDPEDGYLSIGSETYTAPQLAELIREGMRAAGETPTYEELALAAAHAIIHRRDPKEQ